MLTEVEKYTRCYQDPHYHLQGKRLARVTQDVESIPAGARYLDVGCGRAEMVKLAASRGVAATGLELVPELCGYFEDEGLVWWVIEGAITAMPFADRQFSFVSCYDVIEHLPEEEVDAALDELFRVARRELFLTTNDKPSYYAGMPLHLTRQPREWWDAKIDARAADRGARRVVRSTYGNNEWHWEVRL